MESNLNTKNYKPFDLEKAKAGAKVMTRNGRPARILDFGLKSTTHPIVAAYDYSDGLEDVAIYTTKGTIFNGREDSHDLFMCPENHEGWINVYKDTNATYAGSIFKTKEEAIAQGSNTAFYITTTKIEWEE